MVNHCLPIYWPIVIRFSDRYKFLRIFRYGVTGGYIIMINDIEMMSNAKIIVASALVTMSLVKLFDKKY